MSPVSSAGSLVRVGLAWSSLANITLRLGSLTLGIVLARLLTPEQFGVFAVALTVQTVLVTLADLGLSADLVRSDDPYRRAPTVATLGLVAGAVLASTMALSGHAVADVLGSPGAGAVITVLSLCVFLSGVGVVPFALLQRRFAQKKLFTVALAEFLLSTTLTLVLVHLGWGVMALAVAKVSAQVVSTALMFVVAGVRPRFGVDRTLVRSVLAFGVPVGAANMLSWVLISADNVVVARLAGATALGFYVLAFNVSNWPMSAVGQAVRSIALPTFARSTADGSVLPTAIALTWSVGLPMGALLAVLSGSLIEFVYGSTWLASGPVLAALGLFGALRLLFDVMASYLLAHGRSRPVLWVQILWLATLIPTLVAATGSFGIRGTGWAHVAVGVVVVLPAYLFVLHRDGVPVAPVVRVFWPPVAAAVPAGVLAYYSSTVTNIPAASLGLGGLSGIALYALLMRKWVTDIVRNGRIAFDEH